MKNRIRYTVDKVLSNSFYQMPKFLFEGECKDLSNDARVLYMLLKDRHELSVKNEWYNDKKEVYLIMKREEMGTMLNLAPFTVRKILTELKNINLIEEERQGLNKPNLIFLLECQNVTLQTVKKSHSGKSASDSQEREKMPPNHTYLKNHTNLSYTKPINQQFSTGFPQPQQLQNDSIRYETMDANAIKAAVKDKIALYDLQHKHPDKHKELQELFDIILEVLLSRKKLFRIAKEEMPASSVKQVFAALDFSHVEYVLECLSKNTSKVKSTKAYLQTALFNAPKTITNHYSLDSQNFLFSRREHSRSQFRCGEIIS